MKVRKAIWAIIIVFVVYSIWKDPTNSGQAAGNIWGAIEHGFNSIITFFNTMINQS